jgi:PhzF family phenazine biosynthesis protein
MHMKRYRCFGTGPDTGNEALVVFLGASSGWSIEARQEFAAAKMANACVFITSNEDDAGPCVLDFYYPHARSPLCLHASLAAARYLHAHGIAEYSGSVLTSMTRQLLSFKHSGNELHVSVTPGQLTMLSPPIDTIAKMLNCAESAIRPPAVISSIGSPKLLVEMVSTDELYALRPRLQEVVDWGKQSAVSGIYAYAHREPDKYEGRNFNHLYENLEDAATGVAAGALSVLLAKSITVSQGVRLGNRCQISASRQDGSISVGGMVFEASSTGSVSDWS